MHPELANSVFSSFLVSGAEHVGVLPFLLGMILAFLSGLVLAYVYKQAQSWNPELQEFMVSLVLFTVIFSVVTMVIGSNIARAFGLVGALSIIRFRNTVKSIQDILFIFWSLCIGMTIGSGYFLLSLLFLATTTVLFLFLSGLVRPKESIGMTFILRFERQKYVDSKKRVENFLREKSIPFHSQVQGYHHSNQLVTSFYSLQLPIGLLESKVVDDLGGIEGVSLDQDFVSGSEFSN